MAWIIQNLSGGPVIINDLNITLIRAQMKDLDLLGREIAERSNDVKILIANQIIATIRKDPYTPAGQLDPKIVDDLKQTAEAAKLAAQEQSKINQEQQAQILKQNAFLEEQKTKMDELTKQSQEQQKLLADSAQREQRIIDEVKAYFDKDPLGVRKIKEALDNIKIEKAQVIAEQKAPHPEMSERELEAHNKILERRVGKLDRNYNDLGKTVSAEAEDMDEVMDAMDDLGI